MVKFIQNIPEKAFQTLIIVIAIYLMSVSVYMYTHRMENLAILSLKLEVPGFLLEILILICYLIKQNADKKRSD